MMPTFPTIKKDVYIFKAITCTRTWVSIGWDLTSPSNGLGLGTYNHLCKKCVKIVFLEDKCGLIFPILDPYSSHMALPMWVQHGTLLQIPHESLIGCPCRTHINTHLGPMWVLYFLLAGRSLAFVNDGRNLNPRKYLCGGSGGGGGGGVGVETYIALKTTLLYIHLKENRVSEFRSFYVLCF